MNSCTAVLFGCVALIAVCSASVVAHPRPKIGSLEFICQTQDKLFYKGANVETFESASNDCQEIGGKLATITTAEDLAAIRKALEGQVVGKVWMGLVVKNNEACRRPQVFTAECWEWENLPAPAPDYYILWSAEANNGTQVQQISKGYLDVVRGELNFDVNTSTHPYMCEITLN